MTQTKSDQKSETTGKMEIIILVDGEQVSKTSVTRKENGGGLFPTSTFRYRYEDSYGTVKLGEHSPGTFRSQGPAAAARLTSEVLKAVVTESRQKKGKTENTEKGPAEAETPPVVRRA